MKTRILLFVMIISLISSSLIAQKALKKGSYSLSGSATFGYSENDADGIDVESFGFNISPGVSYFLMDNFSAGIDLSFGYMENTFKSNYSDFTNITRLFSIGPHARYYFPGVSINPFIEAGVFFSSYLGDDNETRGFSIAGGMNLFISDNAALEPFVEYSKRNLDQGDQDASSIMGGLRISYFIVE